MKSQEKRQVSNGNFRNKTYNTESSLNLLSGRVQMAEESISEPEDRPIEIIQSEQQKNIIN